MRYGHSLKHLMSLLWAPCGILRARGFACDLRVCRRKVENDYNYRSFLLNVFPQNYTKVLFKRF